MPRISASQMKVSSIRCASPIKRSIVQETPWVTVAAFLLACEATGTTDSGDPGRASGGGTSGAPAQGHAATSGGKSTMVGIGQLSGAGGAEVAGGSGTGGPSASAGVSNTAGASSPGGAPGSGASAGIGGTSNSGGLPPWDPVHVESVPAETAPSFIQANVPAFPGAEGAGKWTYGGRGGRVYEVTSLADSGPGSLREAVEAKGPRTVVFRTGGIVHLQSRLVVTNPYLTIAGQTAPGGGIVIAGRPFWINTYNVIVRHIRVRYGDSRSDGTALITDDAFGGRPVSDLIVDHVSASWGRDENLSFYKMEDVNNDGHAPATERITVQWSIIGEAQGERFHPYGTVFGGKHATYHHNLHACQISWEPYKEIERPLRPLSLDPAPDDLNLINNVFFVWLNRGLEGGGPGTINIINNWFVPDADPYVEGRDFPIIQRVESETQGQRSRYLAGNVMQGRDDVTANNWLNVQGQVEAVRSEQPFEMLVPIPIESAEAAYQAVLERSGATLPTRDAVDQRIVAATRNQTSYYLPIEIKQIDFYPFSVEGVVDFPEYAAGTAPPDDDHDGIPNAWESVKGLDPADPRDGARLVGGYSNLEWYINALAGRDPEALAIAYP